MKQILAIFLKDARRFWPEIAASLAVTAALVLVYPMQWRVNGGTFIHASTSFRGLFTTGSGLSLLAECLVVLVPVSWWILIARLVHGERLVGHTQFWLTRPYDWRKFVTAKLLFVAVFVWAPFVIAQVLLLARAGLNPFAYIPGLLFNLCLVTGLLIVPLLALSAVTSGFGRMTLVLLGLIVFILVVVLLFALRPSDVFGGIPSLVSGYLALLVLAIGSAAAFMVQYARRRLRAAWVSLAVIAAAFILLGLFDPDQSLLGRTYAADADPPPVQLAYAAGGLRQPMTNATGDKRELQISIPLSAASTAQDSVIVPVAMKAIFDAPNGHHWESPWQGASGDRFLPGPSDFLASFNIRSAVYDQFKSEPLTVRLVFALDKATLAGYTTIPLAAERFVVPNLGVCTPQETIFETPTQIIGIGCRAPLREPMLTFITAHWTQGACPGDSSSPGAVGTAWVGSLDSDPAQFGIVPVWDTPVFLSNSWPNYRRGEPVRVYPRQLCPGTPITFARFARTGKTQVSLTIPNFRLPELAIASQMRISVSE